MAARVERVDILVDGKPEFDNVEITVKESLERRGGIDAKSLHGEIHVQFRTHPLEENAIQTVEIRSRSSDLRCLAIVDWSADPPTWTLSKPLS